MANIGLTNIHNGWNAVRSNTVARKIFCRSMRHTNLSHKNFIFSKLCKCSKVFVFIFVHFHSIRTNIPVRLISMQTRFVVYVQYFGEAIICKKFL